MRTLLFLAGTLTSACLLPYDEHTPNGVRVIYSPNTRFRLSDQKLQEIDDRLEAVKDCIPDESFCSHAIPEVYITRSCDLIQGRYAGEYDPSIDRIYVPRSLHGLAHESTHHYACSGDGGKTLSNLCGNRIDAKFRALYPPNCEE